MTSALVSWSSLAALGVGAASGVLSALAGVGGAVLTTPGLRALGAAPEIALGSTVPAIIPSAITGSIRYRKEGLIDERVALWCGASGAVSAFGGALASDLVDARWLMVVTAVLMLYSAFTLLRAKPKPIAVAGAIIVPPALGLILAIGTGSGFVAGLLGVGGGLIMVPAFTLLLKLDVKTTVATSLVAVAMMSVTSLIGHWLAGHIDWGYAVPLMIGVIPGARLGSKITVMVDDRTMRRICGGLMGVMGVIYLYRELGGIL